MTRYAQPEGTCEYCGFPLRLLDRAISHEGRAFCTPGCAHRYGSHDQHRRKITDEERAAFYPASNHLHGKATVRDYVRI